MTENTRALYDLREALNQPGCPVCRLVERDTWQYLDYLLWENVNDPGLRREIRRALGFCREHTRMLVSRPGASLGLALIARDVWEEIQRTTGTTRLPVPKARQARATDLAAGLLARLTPEGECPACAYARTMEDLYLDTLLERLQGENGLLAPYQASEGLCLPHFRRVLTRVQDSAVYAALIEAQRAIGQRRLAELDEFIRKNDYRFRDEPWGRERDAWLRSLSALVGGLLS
jgi:hypothetical protein